MKSRLFILFFVISWAAFAQKPVTDPVPQLVEEAFLKEYPDAKIKSWEKDKNNFYALTKIDGQNAKATISPAGEWIETNFEISQEELPGKITNYLAANYAGYEPNISRYTESKNNGAYYYLTIRKKAASEDAAELYFDVSGGFMKKNEYHPISATISSSAEQEAKRKAKEDAEKKEYNERRAKLLAMDRTIPDAKMPAKVKDNFRKKFPKGIVTKWDSLDNIYTAYFTQEEMQVKADFGLNADWLATYEDVTGMEYNRVAEQYIATNYPALKLKFAERVTRRDKNNYFYVELAHKAKKGQNPPLTKLTFDKNGNLTKEEIPVIETPTEDQGTKEVTEEGPDVLDKQIAKEGEVVAAVAADEVIDASELPSPILTYVADFKGYKIYKAYFGDYPEGDNMYKVEIRKEGVGQKGYFLYFDNQGKYVSGDAPENARKAPKTVAEPVQDESVSPGKPAVASRAPAAKKTKGSAYVDPGDVDDVPDLVKKNFSKKYPKAQDPFWTVDEQKFTVEFMANEMKNTITYGPDGKEQVTRVQMNPDLLMNPINRYLEENYKGYKVRYAEKVTRKDRKNHIYLEIFTKKKNANPPETQLYFDMTGRLMQNPPE
jgi:hypothetical protein